MLAFPRSRWIEANNLLRGHRQFALWTSDPVLTAPNDAQAEPLAFKYYGYCSRNGAVRAEPQVAPMLIGLFWEVEHSAIYKPSPQFKGVLAGMGERTIKVYEALKDFESEFERLIQLDPLKKNEEKGEKEEEEEMRK